MSHRRNGLRALALSFTAVLAVMALSTPGAQAQSFVVELKSALAVGATGELSEESVGLLQVLDLNIFIECNNASGEFVLSEKSALAFAEFSECFVLDSKKHTNELCDVDPIKAVGRALAISLDEVLLLPNVGKSAFASVLLLDSKLAKEEELECNLDEHNEVTGAAKALILYPSALHETNPVLYLEAKLLLLEPPAVQGDVLKFGGHTAHIVEGKISAVLKGDHLDKCWGIE
jgi:hypothetical protein